MCVRKFEKLRLGRLAAQNREVHGTIVFIDLAAYALHVEGWLCGRGTVI
jgi:hypothetical protein